MDCLVSAYENWGDLFFEVYHRRERRVFALLVPFASILQALAGDLGGGGAEAITYFLACVKCGNYSENILRRIVDRLGGGTPLSFSLCVFPFSPILSLCLGASVLPFFLPHPLTSSLWAFVHYSLHLLLLICYRLHYFSLIKNVSSDFVNRPEMERLRSLQQHRNELDKERTERLLEDGVISPPGGLFVAPDCHYELKTKVLRPSLAASSEHSLRLVFHIGGGGRERGGERRKTVWRCCRRLMGSSFLLEVQKNSRGDLLLACLNVQTRDRFMIPVRSIPFQGSI